MIIAISGASGLIGSKLVESLNQKGDTVVRLVRDRTNKSTDRIFWNPSTKEIEADRLEGTDVVIHLAGKPLDEERWTTRVKAEIYASRIGGTKFISETMSRLRIPPRLLISASATDYYAFSAEPVGEEDGRPGRGFVSEMCQDWERATDPAQKAGIRTVHIRIPSVLSKDGHSILAGLLPLFRKGLGPVIGTGKQLMCFIARDDMVRAIQHIIEHDELCGPVNVLAPQPVTNADFASILSRVVHRPRFLRVPGPILRLVMGEVAEALLEGDASLRPRKLVASGFEFRWPDLESALRHELSI
ncbi:MAG TPA: TIGR01777 family oxidoreductase [Terriglobales bacterium]|nr:TIGR01777 family oxidoreductase [Terriglobales bacterium]